jgi:hypothetical protein
MQGIALTGWHWVAIALGVIGLTIVIARKTNSGGKTPDDKPRS